MGQFARGKCERPTELDIQSVRIPRSEGDLGDPHVLPDERTADLLHRPDGVQSARNRPLGPRGRVRRLLRLVGLCPSAGLHPVQQAVRGVREQRGDQQLPAARRRGAEVHGGTLRRARRPPDGRDGVLRRGDRGDLSGIRLQPDPAAGLAAPTSRLQDRHHQTGRGSRRAVGAQRAGACRQLRGALRAGDRRRAGLRPGGADSVRRLRQDDVLHHLARPSGTATARTSSART